MAKPLKDNDKRDQILLAKRAFFAFVGGNVGGLIGIVAVDRPAGYLVGAALGALASWHYIELWGRFAAKFYFPSGRTTPYRHQYSQALALVMQGKLEAAIAELERDIAEDPQRPDGYLHLARLYRDKLQRYEDAATWFKRARRDAQLSAGETLLVTRELCELYMLRMQEPARAIPELARLAETQAGTPGGEWARAQLAELRAARE